MQVKAVKSSTSYRILSKLFALALILVITSQNAIAGKRFQSNYPCKVVAKTCIDSGTKIIDQEPVHRDCWKYTYTTICNYPSKDDCFKYSHCYFVQIAQCLLSDSYGNCVNQKKEFSCKRWVPLAVEEQKLRTDLLEKEGQEGLICKGIPCIDGNCVNKAYLTNGEMMDSISKLYALSQMKGGKDLNFKLFEGTNLHCSKKATSYSNCCSENLPGWGRNIGASCTQDEKTLIDNRKKNLCLYVGKQNKQTMGITTLVKHHFCCFGNMLDKVIQIEGRKQLNDKSENNFGTASNPDCRGLTLEELQRIDFSKLDFSEFIEDFKLKFFGKYEKPNSADIVARISGSTKNIRRYDDNPNNPKNNFTGWNLGLKDDSFEANEEKRFELDRKQREAERLELERRKKHEQSEEYKRRLEQEQKLLAEKEAKRLEQEAEARRLLAEKEALKAERRKHKESELNYRKDWKERNQVTPSNLGHYYLSRMYSASGLGIHYQSTGNHDFHDNDITRFWDKYKHSLEICDRYNPIWNMPEVVRLASFFLSEEWFPLDTWCKYSKEINQIEDDLSKGNY